MKKFLKKRPLVTLIIVILGIYIFRILFPVGYEYVDPQPDFLVTLTHGDNKSIGIILESDLVYQCPHSYDLRATTTITATETLVNIDGVYQKKTGLITGCRPSGWRRPIISLTGGDIDEGTSMNLIFIINDRKIGNRMNKYMVFRANDELDIEPKQGGFTTIIARDGMGGIEKYSKKYDYKTDSGKQEQFKGDTYFVY